MARELWQRIVTALKRLPRTWPRNAVYSDVQIVAVSDVCEPRLANAWQACKDQQGIEVEVVERDMAQAGSNDLAIAFFSAGVRRESPMTFVLLTVFPVPWGWLNPTSGLQQAGPTQVEPRLELHDD